MQYKHPTYPAIRLFHLSFVYSVQLFMLLSVFPSEAILMEVQHFYLSLAMKIDPQVRRMS